MTFSPLANHGLYVITDGPRHDLLDVCAQALRGGARLLQYRDKTDEAERRLSEARALRQLCAEHHVPMIVNDDIELAAMIEADGVHLGGKDGSIEYARSRLGAHAIIGASCYDSLELAHAAARAGASYIAFGAFFASPTKPLAPRAPIELLRQSAALGLPRVAIGGITPDNGATLVEAGADYLAVISAVFAATDVHAATQRFAQLYPAQRE